MIYYVEDDERIRELALYTLKQSGFESLGFRCARDFFAACERQLPDVVLLDIMLPDMDGLEILRHLRSNPKTNRIPVMMLTAKGTEIDTVIGLDSGADDYLAKPFGMMELVSRIRALLRRTESSTHKESATLSCGPITLIAEKYEVYVGEIPVSLTVKEFNLLRALMENAGCVMSRAQLLEHVWEVTFAGGTRTVDVHIQTLRQKLDAASPGVSNIIETVRGVGYRIRDIS